MDKYDILKAVDNGLAKGIDIINFDKVQTQSGFTRTRTHVQKLTDFNIGDYVYYSPKYGYTNRPNLGRPIAVCVNSDGENNLFALLDHALMHNEFVWANKNTDLYDDQVPTQDDGFANTQYIKEHYKDQLAGTIWEYVSGDEYIPSTKQLEIIFNNFKNGVTDNIEISRQLRMVNRKARLSYSYWTSSQMPPVSEISSTMAGGVSYSQYKRYLKNIPYTNKNIKGLAIVLLNI